MFSNDASLFGAVLTFVLALSTGSVLIYIAGGMAIAALMTAVEVRVRVRLKNVRAPRAKLTLGSSAPDRSVLDRHYHHILGIAFFGLLALEVPLLPLTLKTRRMRANRGHR
jgi:hypothetical protein